MIGSAATGAVPAASIPASSAREIGGRAELHAARILAPRRVEVGRQRDARVARAAPTSASPAAPGASRPARRGRRPPRRTTSWRRSPGAAAPGTPAARGGRRPARRCGRRWSGRPPSARRRASRPCRAGAGTRSRAPPRPSPGSSPRSARCGWRTAGRCAARREQAFGAGEIRKVGRGLAREDRIVRQPALLRALDLGVPVGALDQAHRQPPPGRVRQRRRPNRRPRRRASGRPAPPARTRPNRRGHRRSRPWR